MIRLPLVFVVPVLSAPLRTCTLQPLNTMSFSVAPPSVVRQDKMFFRAVISASERLGYPQMGGAATRRTDRKAKPTSRCMTELLSVLIVCVTKKKVLVPVYSTYS